MVTPPLRTKSLGFKVSEEEYAQLETAARTGGSPLYTKSIPTQVSEEEYAHLKAAAQAERAAARRMVPRGDPARDARSRWLGSQIYTEFTLTATSLEVQYVASSICKRLHRRA